MMLRLLNTWQVRLFRTFQFEMSFPGGTHLRSFNIHPSFDPSAFLCGRCFMILSMKILRDDGLFHRAVIMEVLRLYRCPCCDSSDDGFVFTECCNFNVIVGNSVLWMWSVLLQICCPSFFERWKHVRDKLVWFACDLQESGSMRKVRAMTTMVC